ncbi:hypothetical protein M9H77_10632 [Catharanthus roseus]|uniref:Uncharacterized protein n=1 Tax=Catharanthus roseus TaxID=4058 RepID=A0ACC0BCI1_CATRO|nr:hypothetical protein M9H77_10632 [Catharanthus roseus]
MFPIHFYTFINKSTRIQSDNSGPVISTMSTPLQYYRSLPPVAKTYAAVCLMTTTAYHLGLYYNSNIALVYSHVFRRLQVWRLITNFFFLGKFSFLFGIRILNILQYGVSLEKGAFDKRTADYLWMFIFGTITLLVMSIVPIMWSPFKGPALVFMIVYVWSRENKDARVSIHGLVEIRGFYLPWVFLGIDTIIGYPWQPGLEGIAAGHLYYFLTVIHPLSGGKNYLKTPLWVHKLVAFWGEGFQQNSPYRSDPNAGFAFRGRSFRLNNNGNARSSSSEPEEEINATTAERSGSAAAFRGRGRRLGTR